MSTSEPWTYGAEFELSDFDNRIPLAKGQGYDRKDNTQVNSDGIAVDPKGELYHLGGEVLTAPSESLEGPAEQLIEHIRTHPGTNVNYRSNLHIHVRIPGLRENLVLLKRVQSYIHHWMPSVLPLIEPIPVPRLHEYRDDKEYAGARSRYNRRRISHQKMLSEAQFHRQMQANTPQKFFEAEALHEESGQLLWATCPRACVNLRQLIQTDTVEFRHFPGTLDPAQVTTAVSWCHDFLKMASEGDFTYSPVEHYWEQYAGRRFPTFEKYNQELEEGYRLTSIKYNSREVVRQNIPLVLARGIKCSPSKS